MRQIKALELEEGGLCYRCPCANECQEDLADRKVIGYMQKRLNCIQFESKAEYEREKENY